MRNRKKNCCICGKEKETLYRFRYEEKFIERNRAYEKWALVCEYCLKDIKKKFEQSYQYEGTWKSKKKVIYGTRLEN